MKVVVLGAGLVGRPMAIDLAKNGEFEVTSVDYSDAPLERIRAEHPDIDTIQQDLGKAGDVSALVSDYDLVVSAVPGFMGYQTLRAIIEAGKSAIDIAFFPMNLPYTMTPEMVTDASKALKPKILYQYHFGQTDTSQLVALLKDEPEIEIRIRKLA